MFKPAETDFKLRGPGELFGAKQHGLPPFRITDLLRNTTALKAAKPGKLILSSPPEHTVSSGLQRNSLGNVSRGERI